MFAVGRVPVYRVAPLECGDLSPLFKTLVWASDRNHRQRRRRDFCNAAAGYPVGPHLECGDLSPLFKTLVGASDRNHRQRRRRDFRNAATGYPVGPPHSKLGPQGAQTAANSWPLVFKLCLLRG